jgi:hypothetical protein
VNVLRVRSLLVLCVYVCALQALRDADLSLTPTVVDVGGDASFRPRIDALNPADREALGAATVLITVSNLAKRHPHT